MFTIETLTDLSIVDYYTSPFGVIATLISVLYLVGAVMILRKIDKKTNRLH